MAEKLSIQIALQGGAEVEKQLADIGKAGEKAFAEIEKSASQVGGFKNLKPEDVTAKLKALGIEGTAAFDKIQQAVAKAANFEKLVSGVQSVETGLMALARALPVIGVAAVAAFTAAAKATIAFSQELSKVGDEARKLGLGIEQFDRLRLAFEGAGVSAQGVAGIMQRLGQAAEKADLSRVAQAAKELQEAMSRGFGAQGTEQLRILEQAANKAGAAGKAAREELVKLGLPIPLGVAQTLEELIAKTGSAESGLKAFIEQLRQMPAGAERDKLAMQELGVGADKLIAAYDKLASKKLGSPITPDMLSKADELTASVDRLKSAWDRFGSVSFAPLITTQLNAVTGALQSLQALIEGFSWSTVVNGVIALGNALKGLTIPGLVSQALQAIFGNAQQATQAAQQTGQALQQTGQAGAQAGQQVAQGAQQAAGALKLITNPFTGMAEAARETTAAVAQTGQAGQQAGQQATQGYTSVEAILKRIQEQAGQTGEATKQVLPPDASSWTSWASTVVSALQSAISKLLEWIGLKEKSGAGGSGGGTTAPGKARGGMIGGRGTGTSDSNLAWLSRGEYIMPARAVRQPGVLAYLEAMRRSGGIPGYADGGSVGGGGFNASGFITALGGAIGRCKDIWEAINNGIQGVNDSLAKVAEKNTQVAQTAEASLRELQIQLATILGELVSAAQGRARGGLLGGRGTGTSDSNLAWVSRGEHIMPARAVAQPGVLAFLEALRRSGGNLSHVLDGMGRLALGGMVPRAMPAFATGGLAGGMSNVTIQFPGLPPISGLRASSAVVDELHRAAALAQVRSGGRKPSRYS